MLVSLFFGIAL